MGCMGWFSTREMRGKAEVVGLKQGTVLSERALEVLGCFFLSVHYAAVGFFPSKELLLSLPTCLEGAGLSRTLYPLSS